jgi:hypothetical protein
MTMEKKQVYIRDHTDAEAPFARPCSGLCGAASAAAGAW